MPSDMFKYTRENSTALQTNPAAPLPGVCLSCGSWKRLLRVWEGASPGSAGTAGMFLGCFLVPLCSDTRRGCMSVPAGWDGALSHPSPDMSQCHRGLSAFRGVMVGLRNLCWGGRFGGLRRVGRGLGAHGDPDKLSPLLRPL